MILTPADYKTEGGNMPPESVTLKKTIIEPDALFGFAKAYAEAGLSPDFCAVYDENTYLATQDRRPNATQEIVLPPKNLHADERGIELVMSQLRPTQTIVAVGSGTVHDIARYCAAQIGAKYVSVPTAASVDGFASGTSSMTLNGLKVTVPAVSPCLMVADTTIIARAPAYLGTSGVGDILGKHIALADWRISHLLTGEPFYPGIEALTRKAVEEVSACMDELKTGSTEAYGKLMRALVLSGVAMQLAGMSRPAAGAEHYISHLMDMNLPWLANIQALHGEKVGVGTLLCADLYRSWAGMQPEDVFAKLHPYTVPAAADVEDVFARAAEIVTKENADNCLAAVSPALLQKNWPQIQSIVAAIPPSAQIQEALLSLGGKTTLTDLGVDEALLPKVLHWSAYVRNRFTFMRVYQFMYA